MKILMLGAPGSGKGTHATIICDRIGIPHISTGDIFRENVKNGTDLGKKAKEYMDKGELVPDELTCDLVMDRIQKEDCKDGFILDGFPRTIPQAEVLEEALKGIGTKMDFAIDIELADEEIVRRMQHRRTCKNCGAIYNMEMNPPKVEGVCDQCGGEVIIRDDDKPETVQKRLDIYHETTEPLIEFYKNLGILHVVEGITGKAQVKEDIQKILGK